MVSKSWNQFRIHIATNIARWKRGISANLHRHNSVMQTSHRNHVDTGGHTDVVRHGAGQIITIDHNTITYYELRKLYDRFKARRCGIELDGMNCKQTLSVLRCISAYAKVLNNEFKSIDRTVGLIHHNP